MKSSAQTLPAGWEVSPLSEVAIVIQGQSPPGSTYNIDGKGLPFFQGKAEFTDFSPIASKWCTDPNKIAEPGDVLISVRAPVGPTNLANITCCIGRGLAAIRPAGGVPTKFLLYYLRYSESELAGKGTGTTFSAISGDDLREHQIIVPPLSEQSRIVEAVETQLTRLDAAVAALERVRANLKRYRASVLKAAVEGRLVPTEADLARREGRDFEPASMLLERILAERRRRWEESELARLKAAGKPPKDDHWKSKYKEPVAPDTSTLPQLPAGWCWTTIDQLATTVKNGYAKPPNEEHGIPILRISAVRPMTLDVGDIRFLPLPASLYRDFLVSAGDLLFTRYNGSRAHVGVAALAKQVPEVLIHPDKLIRVRLLRELVSAGFIEAASNTGASRAYLEKLIRTTAGQSGVSGSDIKKMPIPLPPVGEQARALAEVQRLLSVADASSSAIEGATSRCARLRQTILKWAFEGKLVDQDPNDESASVLLERIRAERVAMPSRKSRKSNNHQTEAAK